MSSRSLSWTLRAAAIVGLLTICGCPQPPTEEDPNDTGEPNSPPCDQPEEKTRHEKIFTEIFDGFKSTTDCVKCHSEEATDVLSTGHFTWGASTDTVVGFEGQKIGKFNTINNFCIAVPSNEGRCTQCHPSFGWKNNTAASFFQNINNVDCLVCHDTTGTYMKHPSANGGGGPPAMKIDGVVTVVTPADLQEVAYNVGAPTRASCGFCHFNSGGGDNVKRGDLGSNLSNPTEDMDVHMGRLGFTCQTCHVASAQHGISGMAIHSRGEGGASPRCERCHGEQNVHARNSVTAGILNNHLARVACETCHLPAFSRTLPTMVEWYWSEAGQDISPIPTDQFGKPTYEKIKGRFVWAKNVRPTVHWSNGKWNRMFIGNDTYSVAGTAQDPVTLAEPVATAADADAKVYPFKVMRGTQPVDAVNKRVLVPHLFGTGAGLSNPYWSKFDWNLAVADGAAYAGQPYSGTHGFAYTKMYYPVAHEIPPANKALTCTECHGNQAFWSQLGVKDPFSGS